MNQFRFPLMFAPKCRRPLKELVPRQDDDIDLTLSNVFEIDLLCDEWSVVGQSIRKKVSGSIDHGPTARTFGFGGFSCGFAGERGLRMRRIYFAATWSVWLMTRPQF
jgi:hypothetical protein